MSKIEKNRVFDQSELMELKEQIILLMDSARDVTEELAAELITLSAAAAQVPGEAKDSNLEGAIGELRRSLTTTIYEDMKKNITQILDKLGEQVPAYDAALSGVLSEVTTAAGELRGRIEELTALVGEGSLSLSLTDFTGKLTEYTKSWKEGNKNLAEQMSLAVTYLKGMVLTSAFSKDPVNLSTGNFYYEKQDLTIRGPMPLTFQRYYNALDSRTGSIGEGWVHNQEVHLSFQGEEYGTEEKEEERREEPESLVLYGEDGKETTFQRQGEIYRDIHTGLLQMELLKEDAYYLMQDRRKISWYFDRRGRLLAKRDEEGNSLTCVYDEEGKLTKTIQGEAEDEAAPCLHYAYKEGKLREVRDHTGRKAAFFYIEGKLVEVTDPEGHTVSYRYGENGKLRGIKNGRGITGVRNSYEEQIPGKPGIERIVRQRFPDKGEMRYEYRDEERTTVLTERNGAKITYIHDEKLRLVKTLYENGEEETAAYNEKDQRIRTTDRRGSITRYAYDNKGKLTQKVNPLGEKINYTYSGEGKLLCVKAAGKEILRNRYDSRGRMIWSEDGLGRGREICYGEKGLPKEVRRADGSTISLTHDKRGNIQTLTDNNLGTIITYQYDCLNRVTAMTDGEGNETRYTYNSKDALKETIRPDGSSLSYCYNESGKVSVIKDYDGEEVRVTYNEIGRPAVITDKEGRETRWEYDKMWNVAKETTPAGAITCYHYDRDNRIEKVTISAGEGKEPDLVLTYRYDGNGNLTEARAGRGTDTEKGTIEEGTTRYEYDTLNRISTVTEENGARTAYAYDEMGQVTAVTDALGNIRHYGYNEAGELTEETDEAGNTTSYTYTVLGKRESITDPLGRKTLYRYGAGGRLESITYPEGDYLTFTYDKNGNIRTKTNSKGHILSYTYDALGRVTQVSSSEGQKKTYGYDVLGNVTSQTDATGNTTRYAYTLSGKLREVVDAMGNRTEYGYDKMDNLNAVIQYGILSEEPRITRYERDPLGRVEAVMDVLGKEERYEYDCLGRVIRKTDREGCRTLYQYGNGEQARQITYEDGTRTELSYDPLGRLTGVKDETGETRMERDALGRILKTRDPLGRETAYEWGAAGERKSLVYPDGRRVAYGYDEAGRLRSLTEGGHTISYGYDEQGRLKEKSCPGNSKTTYRYDGMGQLRELSHTDREGILDRYLYEYDVMGNKTAVEKHRRGLKEENGRYEYEYDPMNRLTEVRKDRTPIRSYGYDSFGNRTLLKNHGSGSTTTYAYNALNQLVRQEEEGHTKENSVTEYGYDSRGNLTREERDGCMRHTYRYGAANRLLEAGDHRGNQSRYHYNGLGHRIGEQRRTGEGEETNIQYLLDLTKGCHNLLIREEEGKKQTFFWDGNAAIMEESREGGHRSPQQTAIRTDIYIQDEMGSPIRLIQEDGVGGEIYGYDEFGKDLYGNQGEYQPFGYTGYRYDETAGTYFAQAREYSPETGRFMAEDWVKGKMAYPFTLNSYHYCWNNSLRYIDKDGKQPEDYAYIYYVNNPNSAGGFGHTAFLLVKENEMAEYYSFSTVGGEYVSKIFDSDNDDKKYEGMMYTNLNDKMPADIPIKEFIEKGYATEGRYDKGEWIEKKGSDEYTRAIIIPISNESGQAIHKEAQEALINPGTYNLWSNNCLQVAENLIACGGEELVLAKDTSWVKNYPLNGGELYANLSLFSGFIPNQSYSLSALSAARYNYETIQLGEGCID